jgi:hypothetical protein
LLLFVMVTAFEQDPEATNTSNKPKHERWNKENRVSTREH